MLSNLVIDLVAGEPPLVMLRGLAKGLGGGLWITAVVVDKYIYGSLGVLTTIGLRAILGQMSNDKATPFL
jgi:predicted nucleic acid-binding protein